MNQTARRPWWKRKRWAAALAVWLMVASYPLAEGPALYGVERGWWGEGAYGAVWRRPLDRVAPRRISLYWADGEAPPQGFSRASLARRAYLGWWAKAGSKAGRRSAAPREPQDRTVW